MFGSLCLDCSKNVFASGFAVFNSGPNATSKKRNLLNSVSASVPGKLTTSQHYLLSH